MPMEERQKNTPCIEYLAGITNPMDLFDQIPSLGTPLAEQLRPQQIEDFISSGALAITLPRLIKTIESSGYIPNLIFWGPPGSGKSTLSKLFSDLIPVHFLAVNAVDTGAKQLKVLGQEALERKKYESSTTVLFIDEIHRLNKAQQDVLLPFTEKGIFSLIGATTENPGYEINAALLSRCQVIQLERHSSEALGKIMNRAKSKLSDVFIDDLGEDVKDHLIQLADGDARKLLSYLQSLFHQFDVNNSTSIDVEFVNQVLGEPSFAYDKNSDSHYDTISAFIKSIRGSDPDAAVYYLARMLEGGEDPRFIARRLVILASEDVGNADPRALQIAVSGFDAVEKIGLPEAAINLSQVTCYLASCPKSNSSYQALLKAQKAVREKGHLPIPLALRSARNSFAKKMNYGKGYKYSHEGEKGFVSQQFLPTGLEEEVFYEPVNRGFEKNISEYLKWMKQEKKN